MRLPRYWIVAGAAAALCIAVGTAESFGRRQQERAATAAAPGAPADRKGDRAAVREAIDSFIAAFQKGDGKAVAAHWTAEGEYQDDDGATFRGHAALEKAYGEFFTKSPNNSLGVEVDEMRFPSKDTAVVEGHFKLRKAKGSEPIVTRCSFLYTREDGKWLIAIAREWPGDGLTLLDLEWLIGTWEVKRGGTVVTTHYEWTVNKSFIRCHFAIANGGKSDGGMQMIGKDPAAGTIRFWTFEDAGGVGESEATREGKKWLLAARGVTSDGRVLAATNIMTPVDADSFLWQSVNRTLNDEPLPDEAPVKVIRVKK
ncbi:MAG TPA: nuclear transport factor 2 family protein [Gemmataceae bacterium]|jgi:uncharacterized protein (TIGR02246 family)